jgi:hypothetical protein
MANWESDLMAQLRGQGEAIVQREIDADRLAEDERCLYSDGNRSVQKHCGCWYNPSKCLCCRCDTPRYWDRPVDSGPETGDD